MSEVIPLWIAAIHGHAYSFERDGEKARQICVCGWKGEWEPSMTWRNWEWQQHALYEIATEGYV